MKKIYEFRSSWRGSREVILLVREGKKIPILEIKYKNGVQGVLFSPKMVKQEVHELNLSYYLSLVKEVLEVR